MSQEKYQLLIEQFSQLLEGDSIDSKIACEKKIIKLVASLNGRENGSDQLSPGLQEKISTLSAINRIQFFRALVWAQMDKPLKTTFAEAHLLKSKNKRQLDSRLKRLDRFVSLINELALTNSTDLNLTKAKNGWNAIGYKFHDAIEADTRLMQLFFDQSLPSKEVYAAYCGRGRPKWYANHGHQMMKPIFNLRKPSEKNDFIAYVLPLLPDIPDIKSPKLSRYPDPLELLSKLRKIIALTRLADI